MMIQCQELAFLSGTGGSKKEERRWKMITRVGGHPQARTDENVERVRQKVPTDRHLTVRMIADELGINSDRVWRIITEDLGMRKICAKMVPKLLNERQNERRVQVCQNILEQLETKPNLLKMLLLAMSHGSSSTIH